MENQIIDTTDKLEELVEVATQIELIGDEKLTMSLLKDKINELIAHVNELQPSSGRDRGPKSLRTMDENDARAIMLGELKDTSNTECAKVLGLSYGQIYSARKGFTFKPIYKEWLTANKTK